MSHLPKGNPPPERALSMSHRGSSTSCGVGCLSPSLSVTIACHSKPALCPLASTQPSWSPAGHNSGRPQIAVSVLVSPQSCMSPVFLSCNPREPLFKLIAINSLAGRPSEDSITTSLIATSKGPVKKIIHRLDFMRVKGRWLNSGSSGQRLLL